MMGGFGVTGRFDWRSAMPEALESGFGTRDPGLGRTTRFRTKEYPHFCRSQLGSSRHHAHSSESRVPSPESRLLTESRVPGPESRINPESHTAKRPANTSGGTPHA